MTSYPIDGVARTSDLRLAGFSGYTITSNCRPGGPWRQLLPGVVLLSRASPTRRQRLRAALGYAGDGAVITGVDALREQGLPRLQVPDRIHVLQRAERRLSNHDFLLFERTTRTPEVVHHAGLAFACPSRAVLDAARREQNPLVTHVLLRTVVNQGLCSVDELLAELDAGSQRGAALPRSILRDLAHQYSPGSLPSMSRT
jgi:hypothetical protein